MHPIASVFATEGVAAVGLDDVPEFFGFGTGEGLLAVGGVGIAGAVDVDGDTPGVHGGRRTVADAAVVVAAAVLVQAQFLDFFVGVGGARLGKDIGNAIGDFLVAANGRRGFAVIHLEWRGYRDELG